MKRFLLVVVLCAPTTISFAQTAIGAGTIQLGGGIRYNQRNSETTVGNPNGGVETRHEKTNSFNISPNAGYFVIDNLALGLNLSYNSDKQRYRFSTTPSTSSNHNQLFQIGPFATYYRMLSEKFGLAGTLGAGYQRFSNLMTSGAGGGGSQKGTGFYAGLTPSIVYFPIPKFSLGASVGSLNYSRGNSESQDYLGSGTGQGKGSSFDASFGLSYLALSGMFYISR